MSDLAVPQRAAREHVLGLVAEAECGRSLVLRGSAAMPAWVGEQAREPGDIDFVVLGSPLVPVDPLHRRSYVDDLVELQSWPEAAHGAGRAQMWEFEEFGTDGRRASLPPEGLHWLLEEDLADELTRPHVHLVDLIAEQPLAAAGVRFDADDILVDHRWDYLGYTTDYASSGARLHLPWQAGGGVSGSLQLDFAYDERLPEPPVWLALPRGDRPEPTVLLAASKELSLAWKLEWISADRRKTGAPAAKDVYDAVLLAELPGMHLPRHLRRRLRNALEPSEVRRVRVDWADLPGEPRQWLDRLAEASARLLGAGPSTERTPGPLSVSTMEVRDDVDPEN